MPLTRSLLLKAALAGLALLSAAPSLAQTLPPVEPARLHAHIAALSSDQMAGRAPGTQGDDMAAAYAAGALAAYGFEPAGPGGSWYQEFNLIRHAVNPSATVTIGGKAWRQADDVAIMSRRADGTPAGLKGAPLVFAGYGVVAPEVGWNDYAGVDWRGKIAVVLVNDPDFEAAAGEAVAGKFGGEAMTWYGRWPYKYEEAARQGAAGVLIIHEDRPAAYGWGVVRQSFAAPRFDFEHADKGASLLAVEGWMQRAMAVEVLKASGLDLDTLKRQARQPGFRPIALNQTADVAMSVERTVVRTRNVLGRLPGTRHPDETVLIGAHHDHLGVGEPVNGDAIYNGAIDNASGMAAMFELARTIAAGPRPQRSIVIGFWGAEEQGILGSFYYAENPTVDLARTAAAFTIDGIAHNGLARNLELVGYGRTTLDDAFGRALKAQGRVVTPDPFPGRGSYFRSDHFPFARAGVPALSPGAGLDLMAGGVAAGEAADKDWIERRYHKPQDEHDPNWDLTGAARDIEAIRTVMLELANSRVWPAWTKGSEFEALRAKSAAARR